MLSLTKTKLITLTLLSLCLLAPTQAQEADAMLQFQLADQLKRSAVIWNRGDLEGFLRDYVQTEELTFTSGGRIVRGYEALRERYVKSYGESPQTMGQLSFSEIEVWRLAEGRALVLGRWKLDREETVKRGTDTGVFSLIMIKEGDAWKIFHDHTSQSSST